MRLITHPDRIVVRFSASEVASVGLPPKSAQVEYDAQRRLSTYSGWTDKCPGFAAGLDKLIALADTVVYH